MLNFFSLFTCYLSITRAICLLKQSCKGVLCFLPMILLGYFIFPMTVYLTANLVILASALERVTKFSFVDKAG